MTPLQREILLWYHVRAGDYRNGDFSAPAVREAVDQFRDDTRMIEADESENERTYRLSDRGLAFIAHILSRPLPKCHWVVEDEPYIPPATGCATYDLSGVKTYVVR